MGSDGKRKGGGIEALRLELPGGGNGSTRWSTPKAFVPKSPYNLDGVLVDSAKRTVRKRALSATLC